MGKSAAIALVSCWMVSIPNLACAGFLDAIGKAAQDLALSTNGVAEASSSGKPCQPPSAEAKGSPSVETVGADEKCGPSYELTPEEAADIADGQPVLIDMDDLAVRMKKSNNYVLIDVRKPMEFRQGHIKGAVNITFDNIGEKMPEIKVNHDVCIYLYDLSGDCSVAAGQQLIKRGYKKVFNCGSIDDWTGKLVKGKK